MRHDALMSHRIPTERSFGLSVGLVCVALSALRWWRGQGSIAIVLLVAGALLVAAAVIAPATLRGMNWVWSRFAQALGWVNTRLLPTMIFFFAITPVGIVMRPLAAIRYSRRRGPAGPDTPRVAATAGIMSTCSKKTTR